MRVVMFYHSLQSDWNHGNAHFLRGVASELVFRGHDLQVYEPADGWSLQNLLQETGQNPLADFHAAYPLLKNVAVEYDPKTLDLDSALAEADLVLVHEWNEHELVARIGTHRKTNARYRLLFHDTHHRAITDEASMSRYDLSGYDGVLAFGNVLRDLYLRRRWTRRAWTWHEAADTRLFRPISQGSKAFSVLPGDASVISDDSATRNGRAGDHTDDNNCGNNFDEIGGDLVWVGNWSDDERAAELQEFLLDPVRDLRLRAKIHGVRYPVDARQRLQECGIEYGGWLANFRAPELFSRFHVTVHVPRRPYTNALPGIPTIRVFEALACGIPLICAPWNDAENLFTPGKDYLVAEDGRQMREHLRSLLANPASARALAAHGHYTILSRHTCAHRVDELLNITADLKADGNRIAGSTRPGRNATVDDPTHARISAVSETLQPAEASP